MTRQSLAIEEGGNPLSQQLTVSFHDNPEEEMNTLYHEANLLGLINRLNEGDLPEDFQDLLGRHIAYLIDMLSVNLPEIEGQTPDTILRLAARDIQVSRILKERGLVRFYRFCRSYEAMEAPIDDLGNTREVIVRTFQTLNNPDTGEQFTSQESFISWFAKAAHISRSLIFLRFADLDRLTKGLQLELEDAYRQLLTKPKVIGDILRDLVDEWDGSEIAHIDPDVAKRLARISFAEEPRLEEEVVKLADAYAASGNYRDMLNLIDAVRPAIRNLVSELAIHPSARDAKRMVEDAILLLPEIIYSWDSEADALIVEMETMALDEKGNRYSTGKQAVTFIPDLIEKLPTEIMRDLVRRLPIRNRETLDI